MVLMEVKNRIKQTNFYKNHIYGKFIHKALIAFYEFPFTFKVFLRKTKDLVTSMKSMKLFKLHLRLRKVLQKQRSAWEHWSYAWGYFYQSYKPVGITGVRSTETRLKHYGLSELLKPQDHVLDIGANTGFLSLEVSHLVHSVDAVEWNPYLVEAGEMVRQFVGNTKVKFINMSFERFVSEKKYNFVLSLAAHLTKDGGMALEIRKYLEKIHSCLIDGGYLLFETHPAEAHESFDQMIEAQNDIFTVKRCDQIADDNDVGDVRRFYLLQKTR